MEQYLMYLRKSRADHDYTDEPVMDTLKRHRARLDEYCRRHGIYVPENNILFEVATGDSIASRPVMMELLHRVESGAFTAVLCIDMDRLSRGSGADQALVINTFKYSNTQIITPGKTYDFANESDEQFAELGMFIGRNEYRIIKKRLHQGKSDAVKEGKYPFSHQPYGYKKYKLERQRGFSLEVIPEQAEVVRLIFHLFVDEDMGAYRISNWLNEKGYKLRGNPWTACSVAKIIRNPVYIGKIRYENRKIVKVMQSGELVSKSVKNAEPLICDGLHEPIVDTDIFNHAQLIAASMARPHLTGSKPMKNPFSKLLKCSVCGKTLRLQMPHSGRPMLVCPTYHCKTKGVYMDYVEDAILATLNEWLDKYSIGERETPLRPVYDALVGNAAELDKQLSAEHQRQAKIYDLFERGMYTFEDFQTRMNASKEEISRLTESLDSTNKELKHVEKALAERENAEPITRTIVEHYNTLSIKEKNRLLRSVIHHIELDKPKAGHKHKDDFTLTVYPLIPKVT